MPVPFGAKVPFCTTPGGGKQAAGGVFAQVLILPEIPHH